MRVSAGPLLLSLLLIFTLLAGSGYPVRADTRAISSLSTLDSSVQAVVSDYQQKGGHAGVIITDDSGDNTAINAGDKFTIASLYKLYLLWIIQSEIEAGHITDQTPLTLTADNDQSALDGEKLGPYGSTITVDEARRLMITESNNTAAWVLATWLGWYKYNTFLAAHGLTTTYETTTPRDVIYVLRGIANQTLDPNLKASDYALMLDLLKHQQIATALSLSFPANTVFAHKTGHLDRVNHDAGLLFTADGRVIVVAVLTEGDESGSQDLMVAIARLIRDQILSNTRPVAPPVVTQPVVTQPPDGVTLPNGWFYREANGKGGDGPTGYAVVNTVWTGSNQVQVRLYDEFKRLGSISGVGYPASWPFVWNGFVSQVMQKGVLQWRPELNRINFVNVFDELHNRGLDDRLYVEMQVPRMADWSGDTGKPWNTVIARHMAMLDGYPQMRATYNAMPNAIEIYGLPMSSVIDFGPFYAVRLQRAIFQQYKVNTPYAHAGDVLIANGGDVAKKYGLVPTQAMLPHATPVWSDRILVLGPGQGEQVGRSFQILANARVTSGRVQWEIQNASGAILKRGTTASASGSWAQVMIDVDMAAIPGQPVRLVLYEVGANNSALGVVAFNLTYQP